MLRVLPFVWDRQGPCGTTAPSHPLPQPLPQFAFGPAAGHRAVALVRQIIHDARLSRSTVAGRYEPLCVVGVYGAAIAQLEAGNVL